MLEIKLYLYDREKEIVDLGGYRGEDLSKYVGQGFSNVEDITQELDRGEIVLYGYPQQKEFAPETKFIVDIVENGVNVLGEKPLHFIVQKDLVSQPELVDNGYYDHHITFIEPSAIAQKRLVDNISATYKLKDVSLKEAPAYSLNEAITMTNEPSSYTPQKKFGYTKTIHWDGVDYTYTWGKYFAYDPSGIEIIDASGQPSDKKYRDIQDFLEDGHYLAQFRIPKLSIYGGVDNSKNFVFLGYASLDWVLEEYDLTDLYNPARIVRGSFISNSNLGQQGSYYIEDWETSGWQTLKSEWLQETHPYSNVGANWSQQKRQIRKYTETSATTPTYLTDKIELHTDKHYKLKVSLHEFTDSIPVSNFATKYSGSPTLYVRNEQNNSITSSSYINYASTNMIKATDLQTQISTEFVTYTTNLGELVLTSSIPYSALSLLQKAVMNCVLYEKTPNVYIGDINNSDVPFYVDPNFIDELRATTIIENFYNQKNLWEILVEVGNYIHAIPEIRFGSQDRFEITFNRLGSTEQYDSKNTKMSIMNTRGIEDYVSACSSYISNMVQLGGTIEEWVAPKTTDDTYLVSNDTAEIVLTKPIIELLEIKVKCNASDGSGIPVGETRDMTDYIYEENVYNTLSLDFDVTPNRGIAMYYKLGDNKITGGNYQLPQANINAYTQYAIKKIIYCAFFGYSANPPDVQNWENVKVNNYSFFVKYRTKDSVRQNHTRPDLRKYLLSSVFDKVPQHNQFNNQQDVVVDSIKFGNNMYGKLIRTGNTNYTMTEWSNSYRELKHKGELYDINGELYYVARANHIFYATHIISEIEYSKDYNQLSQIIGIPSEPRFYEISEQSLIRREVSIDDYLLITDDFYKLEVDNGYIINTDHLRNLILFSGTPFSKYVVTTYKGDKDVDQYEQNVGVADFYVDVLTPINAYSSENTLTYEWDMIDNFSAGDKVVDVDGNTDIDADKRAYRSLKAVQYTDKYGKAALFDFYILGDMATPLTNDQIKALPESPFTTRQDEPTKISIWDDTQVEVLATNVKIQDDDYNGRGLGLIKDCREALSMNYNLQAITTSDTFVLSPFFYLPNKKDVKLVFLKEEVNKLSNGYINTGDIISVKDTNGTDLGQYFSILPAGLGSSAFEVVISDFDNINNNHFTDEDDDNYPRIKAIAVVCNVSLDVGDENSQAPSLAGKKQFVLARNIPSDWTKAQTLRDWWFGHPNAYSVFRERQ